MSVLEDQNQCSEGGRNREQVQSDGLHGGEERSEPAEKSHERPPHHQRHNRHKSIPDNRLIIGIECRDASNEKRCARHSGESCRAGLPELPHPVDLIAQGNRSSRVTPQAAPPVRHYSETFDASPARG